MQGMNSIGALILAAGGSSRLGRSKLLLTLPNGKPLVRHVFDRVQETKLEPIAVVLGKDSQRVQSVLPNEQYRVIVNPNWESGMSTSIKAGIQFLALSCRAVLVVLGDQPFVSKELMEELIRTYLESGAQIVHPIVNGRQANPVLLDQDTFQAVFSLQGDEGARRILSQFSAQKVPWEDTRILLDIDTEEDYRNIHSLLSSSNAGKI